MTEPSPSLPATTIDRHVGATVRRLRLDHTMSQDALGEEIGVSYQQIQKYETGANRISASRLFRIAQVLGVGPADLFEGLDTELDGPTGSRLKRSPSPHNLDAK